MKLIDQLKNLEPRYKEIIKYVISGSSALTVDLVLLFTFTNYLGMWYLISSILAFLIAFVVSFGLQKFWTFRDNSMIQIKKQAGIYFLVTSMNLVINTGAIYLMVDHFGIWYLYAQVLISGILAITSYLIYKFKIFNQLSEIINNPASRA